MSVKSSRVEPPAATTCTAENPLVNGVQWSVQGPSPFIDAYGSDLLPDWTQPIASVIIVLQRCSLSLAKRTHRTERHKVQLRDRFFQLGGAIVQSLQEDGYLTELFDPRTGWPTCSSAGRLRLDDVAVVAAVLGYRIERQGQCMRLIHPTWGDAVYPSTLLTTAPVAIATRATESIVQQVLDTGGLYSRGQFDEDKDIFVGALSAPTKMS